MTEIKVDIPTIREMLKGKKTIFCIVAWAIVDYLGGTGSMDIADVDASKRTLEALGGVALMSKFNRMGGEKATG